MKNIARMFQKRSVFNLSHDRKFDCYQGQLIPILLEEVLPGDTFKVNTDMLVRCAPMVSPMYHEVNVFTRYFFVPNRLIWSNWEKFITGGSQGTDASAIPTMFLQPVKYELGDYFGLPIASNNITFSALPYRAYVKIYNDWFLDQTLQTPLAMSTADGNDVTTPVVVQKVNWEKDYFTSALPFTQRGNPVTIPLGTTADVTIPSNGQLAVRSFDGVSNGQIIVDSSDAFRVVASNKAGADRTIMLQGQKDIDGVGSGDLEGTADLSTATASSINDLRLAFQIQRFMEKLARSGARYVEYIMAMFGVRSSDARLQRAEYLGGGKSQIIVSEVLQTSATNGQPTPLASMGGHGFSSHRSHEFKKSFEEHGYVVGLMYILPRTAYQQGLPRTWSRTTKFDFYVPALAHLGEQAILAKELYCDPGDGHDDDVWGYQGRFDEYRRRENSVHGDFRNASGLGTWHMGRIFSARPDLNDDFIQSDPTMRPFVVTNAPNMWVYLKNNVTAIRPIPKLGEPGFIDH